MKQRPTETTPGIVSDSPMRSGTRGSTRSPVRLLLLPLAAACLLASGGRAFAVPVSGTMTDHFTGAPVQGVKITADLFHDGTGELAGLEVGEPVGRAETDSAGHWEVDVPPGEYSIWGEATGYYRQGAGALPASGGSNEIQIGPMGAVLDGSMVPNNAPFVGILPTKMAWHHIPKQSFRSMALELSFSGYAGLPASWPTDHLISQITDASGKPVEGATESDLMSTGNEGGGGGGFSSGSASGCEWFNSYRQRPDVEHLKVVAYLESNPSYRAEAPITPDRSECMQTELLVRRPLSLQQHKLDLAAELLDRLPEDEKVPGTMRFVVNHDSPVVAQVKDGKVQLHEIARRKTHPGWNRLAVSFAPSVSTVTPPPVKTIKFEVRRLRHGHGR